MIGRVQCLVLVKFHTFDRVAPEEKSHRVLRDTHAGRLDLTKVLAFIFAFYDLILVRAIDNKTADEIKLIDFPYF